MPQVNANEVEAGTAMKMRLVLLAALAIQGVPAASGAEITRETVVGRWSFDQTCASGDGMVLRRDGTGGVSESMFGTWRLAGRTIVFDVKDAETNKRETLRAQILSLSATSIRVRFGPSDPVLAGKLCGRD